MVREEGRGGEEGDMWYGEGEKKDREGEKKDRE